MTTRRELIRSLPATAATFALASDILLFESGPVRAQQVDAPRGRSVPAEKAAAAKMLEQDLVKRRAIEAMIWGMPAVNLDLMYQAMVRETKARANQMLYWSRLLDWKTQTLTPNTDVIYLTPYFDTADVGPIVLEIPAADDGIINGTIMDAWQMPLEDVGPAGVDEGKGGKYLILPPGYAERIPDGYIALPSLTYQGYALLRSILKSGSDADLSKAVEYGRRIKVYPLSQAANPLPTTYVDASGILYDATIPYDVRFFESLNRLVQTEPWLQRDRAMIDTLQTLGIEKGKSFAPDPQVAKALNEAAKVARALLDMRFTEYFDHPFATGSRWTLPGSEVLTKAVQSGYADPNVYPIDERGVIFTFIFFSPKRLGPGQFYLMVIEDKAGNALDGRRAYRLTVPAKVPVRQYWSATVYDRNTHALIRDMSYGSRSSQSPGLQSRSDGSVELYFGPTPPAGMEANWIPTRSDGQFELIFRFYGPEKPLFEKTWVLPDIEELT